MSYEDVCQNLREKSEGDEAKPREITRPSDRVGKGENVGKRGEAGDVGRKGGSGKSRPKNDCGIGAKGANGKKGVV